MFFSVNLLSDFGVWKNNKYYLKYMLIKKLKILVVTSC